MLDDSSGETLAVNRSPHASEGEREQGLLSVLQNNQFGIIKLDFHGLIPIIPYADRLKQRRGVQNAAGQAETFSETKSCG